MSQRDKNFYRIDDSEAGIFRELAEGITTRIFPGQQAMISIVRVGPNAQGSIHSHEQEQWGYLISGSATRIQDGKHIEVSAGDFWCSPGHIEHGIIGGPEGAVILDVFAPPRPEYMKTGKGFGV